MSVEWVWFWILMPVALLIFVAVFGPNKVKGRRWRGEKEPSVMFGPAPRHTQFPPLLTRAGAAASLIFGYPHI